MTQSAPASPVKQHGRRSLARIFSGKKAGGDTVALTATGSSPVSSPFDLVTRASSASELGSAISVVGPDPGLDPAERRRGLGRLLGRKRAAVEANLPASPAGSVVALAGTSSSVADGDLPSQQQQVQQNRCGLFTGLRKRLHMA